MRFTRNELTDFVFAGLLISLAFAILLSGGVYSIFSVHPSLTGIFIVAFFTAGIGFLLHELMHKFVAQQYGLRAEFKAFYPGLWIALAASFFGFIIAAPGAVMLSGPVTREKNGKIALAGPLTNLILALLFLLAILIYNSKIGLFSTFLLFGMSINSLLALFNMLPFVAFDGKKVLVWNRTVYTLMVVFSLILLIGSWFV